MIARSRVRMRLGSGRAFVEVIQRPVLFQVEQPNTAEHTTSTTTI